MPSKLKKLLICDDDADMRILIAALARGRYEILEAGDGLTAVDRARASHPDLALVDLDMPGIDGIETLRRLLHLIPGIKVTMLTGSTDIATAQKALAVGAHAFVTKPITCNESEFWELVDPVGHAEKDRPWRVVNPHEDPHKH